MAQRSVILSIWTSVLAALVALLGSLGLIGKAAPALASAAAPAVPAPAAGAVRRVGVQARRSWREMMRGGSLPPTIKQRIRAEAHGKSPSVRRSTTAAAMGAAFAAARAATFAPAAPRDAVPVVSAAPAARDGLALAA
ncbi:DUF6344 domain-containing protein [Streptomyces sp. NPDC085524]|uniref:DUF6344 domain-containing protein n=1 Tax=unclassified Streptomyces TaxID=2593676 RepID=UPI0035DE119E